MRQTRVERVKISIWNYIQVGWITNLLFKGARVTLEQEDLLGMPARNQAANIASVLNPFWTQYYSTGQNTLAKVMFYKYGAQISTALALQGISVACQLSLPTFLEQVILYLTPFYPRGLLLNESGIALSFILFSLQVGGSIFAQQSIQVSNMLLIDFKTILIGAVYEKTLRLSQASSRTYSQGQILNLINVDVDKISQSYLQLALFLSAPVQIIVSIILLSNYIGVAVVAGAGALFAILFLQIMGIGFLSRYQKSFLQFGDQRLKMVREVMYGIKIIKFRSLEKFFIDRINVIRDSQLAVLKKFYLLQVYFVGMIQIAPIAMPMAAFLVHAHLKGSFTPAIIFPSLALFNGLFQPILTVPQGVTSFVTAYVSWRRVSDFLVAEESSAIENTANDRDSNLMIQVKNATFEWGNITNEAEETAEKLGVESKLRENGGMGVKKSAIDSSQQTVIEDQTDKPSFRLQNITMNIKAGQKVGIVGAVGSGKSSLMSALIGEMQKIDGEFKIHGSIAYCAQQPWILTDTIEGNIVFNQNYDAEKLKNIIQACGLDKDLDLFPAGLETEIGEKGINLSGGQKARVALARAMYRLPDILLLDDPISALDAQVGRQVFDLAIKQFLKDKTVVLITHQLHLIPELDYIIVLEKGVIIEQGSFKELMTSGISLPKLMQTYKLEEKSEQKDMEDKNNEEKVEINKNKAGIIVEEDRAIGTVDGKVFWHYFEKCGGYTYITLFISAGLCGSITQIINSLWLAWWTSNKFGNDLTTNMKVYGILGVIQFGFAPGGFKAAKYYHHAALGRLMKAPMGFFDGQPIGRIMNRMSKDIESIDQTIWLLLFLATISISGALSSLIFLAYIDQRMLALVIPLLFLYFYILKYYQKSNIEFKRFESNNRSPLYAHFSETLTGISTVKAYGVEDQFIQKQRLLMDTANDPTYLRLMAQVWVSLRLEVLSSSLTLVLCLLGVTSSGDPALIGVSLTYAIGFVRLLNLLLFSSSQLENEFNSVERLSVYCDQLPQEPPSLRETDPDYEEWPSHGVIEFQSIKLSYPSRPDVLILNDVSFSVMAGEKIGVIGRTGSGKSTLMTALYRLIELNSGIIKIDGVDISTLGLETLRSRIQIIPQEPVLFSGTIKENLDVESNFEDIEIWNILEIIGLKDYVSNLKNRLDSLVVEGGENLSVGQRQLICLGRAILMKPKILIMDEATASVDVEADNMIQRSIKTHFAHTTVLSIAHRLNTIADYDRVLVLQSGLLVEFDTPHVLLNNGGLFSELADATGMSNSKMLREIAFKKHLMTE